MAPLPGPAQPPPQPRLLLLPAAPAPRKRQRLAHLSAEEKALRRKLKNRVAAQSARDRKKARMGELERQALELEEQNQALLAENLQLKERAQSLALENCRLRLRLGLPAPAQDGEPEAAATAAAPLKVETPEPQEGATGPAESAALSLRVPLQQGQAQQSPASSAASAWIRMAWTLRMLSLISSWAFWTAWIQTCSSGTVAPKQPAWSTCSRGCTEKTIPYQPPPVPLWGPQHPAWKPLMN
ncbi:X-box-binding protein 1 [Tiliqua scincoides]|uniref:X-box-binding protein 1 n=1 Tax=Tiliqua scincoides TaxID=71010 RepID=UPI003463570D